MILSDRENRKLMPMAAKAAGIRIEYDEDGSISSYWNELGDVWEPLHDDGDALRLAIVLKMNMAVVQQGISLDDPEVFAKQRLAIVRAAAEIGRQTTYENTGASSLVVRAGPVVAAGGRCCGRCCGDWLIWKFGSHINDCRMCILWVPSVGDGHLHRHEQDRLP